jgi:DNA-binding Xre family transcriptional regulator
MHQEKAERRRQVAAIKEGAQTNNDGRSYLLPGLRACRLAAGITQRELAEKIGGTQATVRELERGYRGAYVSTIRKLCEALEVVPKDLLCGSDANQKEARR